MPQPGTVIVVNGRAITYRTLAEVQELKDLRERALDLGKDVLADAIDQELTNTALLFPQRGEA